MQTKELLRQPCALSALLLAALTTRIYAVEPLQLNVRDFDAKPDRVTDAHHQRNRGTRRAGARQEGIDARE